MSWRMPIACGCRHGVMWSNIKVTEPQASLYLVRRKSQPKGFSLRNVCKNIATSSKFGWMVMAISYLVGFVRILAVLNGLLLLQCYNRKRKPSSLYRCDDMVQTPLLARHGSVRGWYNKSGRKLAPGDGSFRQVYFNMLKNVDTISPVRGRTARSANLRWVRSTS